MSTRPPTFKLVRSVLAAVMLATFIGTGASVAFADSSDVVEPADGIESSSGAAEPVPVGTKVVHEFDVVVANLYDSVEDIPSGPAQMTVDKSTIDQLLSDGAQWWSDHTGLLFDFSQNTHYKAINTTCDTREVDAMAVFGHPDDLSIYSDSHRNMLVLDIDYPCSKDAGRDYAGLAWTVSPIGDVFTGGVLEMVVDAERYFNTAVISHEFGHTVGLKHANVLDCSQFSPPGDDRVGIPWDGSYMSIDIDGCSWDEYEDTTSVMGFVSEHSDLNSLQEWYLGVARDVSIIDSPTQETITLSRHDLTDSDSPRGAVISYDSARQVVAFGVEYKSADETGGTPGVYITQGTLVGGLQSDLLVPPGNGTQSATVFTQPLDPNSVFVSEDGRVSIRTISVDEATAQVEITVGQNPGVAGVVSIHRAGDSLIAVAENYQATSISYQWFRNGTPIPEAVDSTYTPGLPDPNAVYRVEATLTADGRGPTTRHSRGIVADDQRFIMDGDVGTFVFLDENGQPENCVDALVNTTVRTSSSALVTGALVGLQDSEVPGVCIGDMDLPLYGTFSVTAESAQQLYGEGGWLEPYWEPITSSWTRTTTEATAVLFVGSYDNYNVRVEPGTNTPPLPVFVSVTAADGTPASDVPVSITIPDGMTLDPASPLFTDSDGLAYAGLQWDPRVEPPSDYTTGRIEASVDGFAQVDSSPVDIDIYPIMNIHMTAWLDKTTAIVDGEDSLTLHVRAWDESGELVENQPDVILADFMSTNDNLGFLGVFSEAIWDDVNKEYVIMITPQRPGSGYIEAWMADDPDYQLPLYPLVTFIPGPATGVDSTQTTAAASQNGICDGETPGINDVMVWPTDDHADRTTLDEPGILFSVPDGSPLVILGDPLVTQADFLGRYHVQVMSSVPGIFDLITTSQDQINRQSGDASITGPSQLIEFINAPIDITASSLTVTDGLRTANGSDHHTVTANLVTQCHVPLVVDFEEWTEEALDLEIHHSDGSDAPTATTQGFVADPDQPGLYTADITSTEPGTFETTTILHHWADGVETVTTLANLPIAFGSNVTPSPSSSATPSPSTSATPSPSNSSTPSPSNPATSLPSSSGSISVQTGGSVAHHTTWWFLPLIALGCGCLVVWRSECSVLGM